MQPGTTEVPAAPLPRLLTADEVSEQLGISRARVYELVRLGVLPCVRLGRAMRFSSARLNEWIEEGGTGYDGPEE